MPSRKLDHEDRLIRQLSRRSRESGRQTREPLTWRDRDRLKDRSKHANRDPRDFPRPASNRARYLEERTRKASLDAANALFENPDRRADEHKLLRATSTELDQLANAFIEKYGYPSDPELLARLVEHSSIDVVKQALERLQTVLPDLDDRQRDSLVQSLKLVSMMGREPAARRAASGFLRRNKLSHGPI